MLSKNTDSAQAQLCRASMPGKDPLVDAVRKVQAVRKMCFSVLFREMLRVSKIQLYLMAFPVSSPSLT